MNHSRFALLMIVLLLVASTSALSGTVVAQIPSGPAQPNTIFLPLVEQSAGAQATIDRRVLADTANGQIGHFLVVLKEQAQVRASARTAPDRASQGRVVFDALRAAAASQAPVIAQLNALGVHY